MGLLGASWGHLEASWGLLGASWGPLGSLLELSWRLDPLRIFASHAFHLGPYISDVSRWPRQLREPLASSFHIVFGVVLT